MHDKKRDLLWQTRIITEVYFFVVYDPRFATSPIFVTDKDYEFSVDPELFTLVECDPFHGYESETVVAHLTKLDDLATLFAHEEKNSLSLYP